METVYGILDGMSLFNAICGPYVYGKIISVNFLCSRHKLYPILVIKCFHVIPPELLVSLLQTIIRLRHCFQIIDVHGARLVNRLAIPTCHVHLVGCIQQVQCSWSMVYWMQPKNARKDGYHGWGVNSSFPGQNDRNFADDVFECTFVNEKSCILFKISLKFVPKGPMDNKPTLV